MKTYVVSYIDFFDNELSSEVIHSDKTEVEVLKDYLLEKWNNENEVKKHIEHFETVEDYKCYCFDSDSMCNIIEVE